jgi:hypothetical protein
MTAPRLMAIDWSGRSGAEQRRALWLAEVVDGELVRLEGGRTRAELIELLIVEADRDPNLIVGFDFAFSLPAWYLHHRQLTPRQLWALLADEALTPTMRRLGLARWMNSPEWPFWTSSEAHARLRPEQMFRRTELEVRAPGTQPKSVFQLIGAGQVGRGSLYGMQALHQLTDAGFRIWPFDPSEVPMAVELFPRVLTGPVRKNSLGERERYLRTVPMPTDFRQRGAVSEDAFDAAVSAVVMADRMDELRALPAAPGYELEGKIWQPRTSADLTPGDRQPTGAYGELRTAVAAVLQEAAARGESAAAQADRVLDLLHRRGVLGGDRARRPTRSWFGIGCADPFTSSRGASAGSASADRPRSR